MKRPLRFGQWKAAALLFAGSASVGAFACVPEYQFDGTADGSSTPDAGADRTAPHDATGGEASPDVAPSSEGGLPDVVADAQPDAAPPAASQVFVNQDSYRGGICALRGGHLLCWGDDGANDYGELGFPAPPADAGAGAYLHPAAPPTAQTPTQVAMGEDHTCYLYGRTASCRGRNEGHQRANTSAGNGPQETPVNNLPPVDVIAASDWATCGIVLGATVGVTSNVWCWGWNGEGESGRPLNDVHDPDQAWPLTGEIDGGPTGQIKDAVAIAGGGLHFCALTARSTIECWGSNEFAESGPTPGQDCSQSYATKCSDQPQTVALPNGEVPIQIALGDRHSCALAKSGNVFCWGADDLNQLGAATVPPATCKDFNADAFPCIGTPQQVAHLGPMTRLYAGGNDTCALDASSHAFCWGANDVGQLGVGDQNVHPAPVEVLDEQTSQPIAFDEIALGGFKACGRSGSTLLCWGNPNVGTQAGDAAAPQSTWPQAVQF